MTNELLQYADLCWHLPLLCCCTVYMRSLVLSGVYAASNLAQLPAAQLQQLRLFVGTRDNPISSAANIFDPQVLPLGHLTSLTMLECIE
jgi:hypothetical protein